MNSIDLEMSKQENNVRDISTIKKIALMGPWGYGNLGDAAIQTAMIQNIHKYYPNAQIYGCSIFPEDTQKRHGISSFAMCNWPGGNSWWEGDGKNFLPNNLSKVSKRIREISNPSIRKLFIPIRVPSEWILEFLALVRSFRILRGFDAFIISGGGQLDDVFNGVWVQPYALFLWGLLSRLQKAKFLIVSVGAGPIDAPLSKFFVNKSLAFANYRSYRDRYSKQYVERVVNFHRQEDPIYPDPAHSLDLTRYVVPPKSRGEQRTIVGIAPIPHKYASTPPGLPGDNTPTYVTYVNKLASFVSWLLQNHYTILFFVGEDGVDRPVIQEIREIITKSGVVYTQDQIIENPISTVDDLMFQLAETDLVVASRFHGVLLSQLLNKPTLALSFHDKIDSLMADSDQTEYCLSIDDFEVEILKARFLALEKNQTIIKEQLIKRTQQYREVLKEQYDHLFRNI
jgi:polysaccharide pyruvyl transferase WcaK-like protein